MKFEWDEAKNRINIQKHGLDFADAPEILGGPLLTRADLREDYGEKRWTAMGLLRNRAVVLAFAERGVGIIRIISLRKANRNEREAFEKALQDRLGAN